MASELLFHEGQRQEDSHWLSVSDLMAGLMVIFLFVAITYIRPILKQREEIETIVVAWRDTEIRLYEELYAEFRDDLPRWNAEIDSMDLSVRFKEPSVFFDVGRTTIKPAFRHILDDFFPRYVDIIDNHRDNIEEIRIEGHTSLEWHFRTTQDNAYFQNMELSQGRTRAVLEYCLLLPKIAEHKEWLRGLITANGGNLIGCVKRSGGVSFSKINPAAGTIPARRRHRHEGRYVWSGRSVHADVGDA